MNVVLAAGTRRGVPGGLPRSFPFAAILLCRPCRRDYLVSGSCCRRFSMTARPSAGWLWLRPRHRAPGTDDASAAGPCGGCQSRRVTVLIRGRGFRPFRTVTCRKAPPPSSGRHAHGKRIEDESDVLVCAHVFGGQAARCPWNGKTSLIARRSSGPGPPERGRQPRAALADDGEWHARG